MNTCVPLNTAGRFVSAHTPLSPLLAARLSQAPFSPIFDLLDTSLVLRRDYLRDTTECPRHDGAQRPRALAVSSHQSSLLWRYSLVLSLPIR